MVVIPAGSFMMGSPASESERLSSEKPQHQVTIVRQFAAGKFEVTFDEWDACFREGGCSHNPGDKGWGRGQRPVIHVSWYDAKQYVQWLSRKTEKSYRLLSEAEWEYSARAGTATAFSWGNTINMTQASYQRSGTLGTVPVGSYAANAFGLYDMHGNVKEWVEDCTNASYNDAPADGKAWTSGDCGQRILRGGAWYDNPQGLRSARRDWAVSGTQSHFNATIGFRVARDN